MHARTVKINEAIRYAKMRDSFRCRVCGNNEHLCGSHAVPRNVMDPTDPNGIVTMCALCDGRFGKLHSLSERAEWLRFHHLDEFADWMAERDGRCAV